MIPRLIAVCQNVFGYSNEAPRTMFHGTVGAYFRYASVYAHALAIRTNRRKTERIYRRMVICCGRLYRTVNYLAATAIGNSLPLCLSIIVEAIVSMKKRGWSPRRPLLIPQPEEEPFSKRALEQAAVGLWQKWYNESPKERWTKHLIPVVGTPVQRIDFYTAQALSGHG